MKYVKRLLEETEYLQWVEELEQAEAERIFCRHGLSHSLDVARIGWILTLERGQAGTGKPGEALKEKIYLTALLHDLGRLSEAKQGTPHHRAGAALAEQLLARIQYPKEDRQEILAAISDHRGAGKSTAADREWGEQGPSRDTGHRSIQKDELIHLIKEADNRSRNCFFCSAAAQCNWSKDRRNQGIFC